MPDELPTPRRRNLNDDAPRGTRWCKEHDAFLLAKDFRSVDGPTAKNRYLCRECESNNGHAQRLAFHFGLTGAEYQQLLQAQGGLCFICQTRPRNTRLAVDHNHKTLLIRGLLCKRCNHDLLGACHENPEMVRRLLAYLLTPPAVAVLGERLAPRNRARPVKRRRRRRMKRA